MSGKRISTNFAVVMGLLLLSAEVRADKYYVGPLNGVWSDPANWSDTAGGPGGAGVPGAGDVVWVQHSDSPDRIVTLDASASISQLIIQTSGSGSSAFVQGEGIDLTTGSEIVAGGTTGFATREQSGGINQTGELSVGAWGNSSLSPLRNIASYAISGGTLNVSNDVLVGGSYTNGTFYQSGGAVYSTGIQIGLSRPSDSYYVLADGVVQTQRITVGNSGVGTFMQSGGVVTVDQLELGRSTGYGEGTYILNGVSASLIVNGNESVGYRGASAHFDQSAGSHWVGGGLSVGSIIGNGTYSYRMSGGTLTVIGDLHTNDYVNRGKFYQSGGAVSVGTQQAPKKFQMDRFEMSGHSSMNVTGSVWLTTFTQTGGDFYVGGSFSAGASGAISGGTLTINGTQFYSTTFNQNGGAMNIPSPSFQSVYTTYYLAGGTYTSPRLSPSRTFYWSGGELNISTLVLGGNTVVTHDSGKTLVINSLVKRDFTDYGYGFLDLTNNNAIVDYAGDPALQITDIREFLATGHLISSTADSTHRLGYGDNADPLLQQSSFSGQTFPANDFSQLLVMYTFGGDANLDGTVNLFDLTALATHWQQTNAFWTEGDFNYDGVVNSADLGILAASWPAGGSSLSDAVINAGLPVAAIPEPGIGVLGLGLLALLRGRSISNAKKVLTTESTENTEKSDQ